MRDTKPNLNNNLFEQFTGDTLSLSGDTNIYGEFEVMTGGIIKINDDINIGRRLQHLDDTNTYLEFTTDKINLTIGDNNIINLQDSNVVRVNGVIELSGSTVKISNNGSDGMVLDDVTGTYNLSGLTDSGITGATNGIGTIGENVCLGGTLTSNTIIGGGATGGNDGKDICFGSAANQIHNFCIDSCSCLWDSIYRMRVGDEFLLMVQDQSGGNNISCITMNSVGSGMTLATTVAGDKQQLEFGDVGICVQSSCRGLYYVGDYSGTYIDRSLVDKGYVTCQISGLTCAANNGLCINGNTISLGGVLTGDTSISGATNDICFGTAASKLETFCIESNTDVWNTDNKFNLGNGFGVSVSSTSLTNCSCIGMSLNGDSLCLTTTNGGNLQKIAFLGDGIRVDSSCYGLCYSGDYGTNFTARSIPDAEWVTGRTITYSGVIDGNLASFDSSSGITDSGISSETVVYDLTDFIEISGTTANTDTVIPAKFRIVSIVFNETSGNAAGNISVGITSGGTDIINAETVGASALIDGAIGTSIFSITSSQLIYITSSAWGSGVVDTYIRMEKFIE
jgi:hypothetical protein